MAVFDRLGFLGVERRSLEPRAFARGARFTHSGLGRGLLASGQAVLIDQADISFAARALGRPLSLAARAHPVHAIAHEAFAFLERAPARRRLGRVLNEPAGGS